MWGHRVSWSGLLCIPAGVGSSAAAKLLACLVASAIWTAPSGAQEVQADAGPYGRFEVWAGVDAAEHQWLTYTGITAAPWSADVYSNGWRFRLEGAYGEYNYVQTNSANQGCGVPLCPAREENQASPHFRNHVVRSYFDALIGYYVRLGNVTAKLFAGAAMSSHKHLVPDPDSSLEGTKFGGKAALELWWNISPNAWSSLDASYATTFDERSARWRAGWLVAPRLSIGPELRYDSNLGSDDDWMSKAGLFARYAWPAGEVSLAGGVATMHYEHAPDATGAYGTLNVLLQY